MKKKALILRRLYPLILILAVFLVWKYRRAQKPELIQFSGKTMGSIQYKVKYQHPMSVNYQSKVDSLLRLFNSSLNHYLPESELSQFNNDSLIYFNLPFFYPVLLKSREIFQNTHGAFNPAIAPLINAWGFGPSEGILPDSAHIDSLKKITSFSLVDFDSNHVWKKNKKVKLDFSAIAKGQAVDVIYEFLIAQNISNLLVDIGGEVRALGTNETGEPWSIGIIDPRTGPEDLRIFAIMTLNNQAMATSANNYNYIEIDGKRWVHTIDPESGYPVQHTLLSTSIVAKDCMTADGYATACMVMGLEECIKLVEQLPEIEAFLIYNEKDVIKYHISPGIAEGLIQVVK